VPAAAGRASHIACVPSCSWRSRSRHCASCGRRESDRPVTFRLFPRSP